MSSRLPFRLFAGLFLLLLAAPSAAQRETPVLDAFEAVPDPSGSRLHVMVEPDRGVGWRLGMGLGCQPGERP